MKPMRNTIQEQPMKRAMVIIRESCEFWYGRKNRFQASLIVQGRVSASVPQAPLPLPAPWADRLWHGAVTD